MKVSIVYHSESGNTEEVAKLIKTGGMQHTSVDIKCMSIDQIEDVF